MTSFTTIATRARGAQFDSGLQTDALRYVRQALGKIYRSIGLARGDLLVSENLVVGTNTVSVAAIEGARVACVLMGDTGQALDEVDRFELQALALAPPTLRGRPQVYAIVSLGATVDTTVIEVWPTADANYTLYVGGRQAPGAADVQDADDVPLPEVYEEVLAYWARKELYAFADEDTEMAAYWTNEWTNGLKEIASDLQRRSSRNRQVPGTWGNMRPAGPTFHHPHGLF